MDLLLGIDIGSTHCKAGIYNCEGYLITLEMVDTVTHYNEEGWAWYEPDELWSSIKKLLQEITKNVGSDRIVGLSVTSVGEAGIPIDKDGNPVYPIIAWFDQRSLPQAEKIGTIFGRQKIFQISGMEVNPIFSLTKILWLKENKPEAFRKLYKWLSISDFIIYMLTGEIVTSYSMASRTMALDLKNNCWSEEILTAFDLPRTIFPALLASGVVVGKVTRQAAAETGLPQGTPAINGGHDHFCGSLASGVLLNHRLLDSSGTAESINILIEDKKTPPTQEFKGFRVGRYLDPQYYYLVGGIVTSGGAVDWLKGRIGSLKDWNEGMNQNEIGYDLLMQKAGEVPAGARGLLFMPHIRGGGAPYWDPNSRGTIIGLTFNHTSPEIMRALLEGLCFETRNIIQAMREVVEYPIDRITTIGGGIKNELWQKLKADITGLPIEIPDNEEAAAMGAALLAGVGAGIYPDMYTASKLTYRIKKVYQPNQETKDFYDQLFSIYQHIYYQIKDVNHQLATILSNKVTKETL